MIQPTTPQPTTRSRSLKLWQIISLVVITGFIIAVLGGFLLPKARYQASNLNVDLKDQALIARGKYIAQTADCVACHTTLNGKPYAGGLPMLTPLGAVYSTNITPDKETGIGDYTFEQFNNAVKHGIRADNKALYPAMPYPSYQIMPDADVAAMYAYFMSLPPVKQANKASELPPVLNWRWPLAYWQVLFAPKREFTPEQKDPLLVKGQYLVEGPGHCGSCHTGRGIGFQELTLTNGDNRFLAGAVIDGWRAKSLRGEAQGLGMWSQAELVEFFKTGRTDKTAAFGAMADVVEHSTQHWTDSDLQAMSAYLKTLTPISGRPTTLPAKADTTTAKLLDGKYENRGAILYAEYCQVCHRADGRGIKRIFPALAGNSAVIADDAESVLQITMNGGRMPLTPHDRMAFTMPAFQRLGDDDIVQVSNFIRNSWGNEARPVTIDDVVAMRQFLAKKPVTATDLPQDLKGETAGNKSTASGVR